VKQAADDLVHMDRLIWVVVGDLSKIEAGIRELGYGDIRFINADGQPINKERASGGQ
jgi:zinc protease